MKQTILLLSILLFTTQINAQCSGNVTITDTNLKNVLVQHGKSVGGLGVSIIDTNNDGEIQCSEANTYTGSVTLINRNVTDLTGLEQFTNITRLFISYNNLTTLNVTTFTKLIRLDANNNDLTSLDISKNTLLETLSINDNNLTSLNIDVNLVLKTLNADSNSISSLDITKNTSLETVSISYNNLSGLDISKNINLKTLNTSFNTISSLNITNNTSLETLNLQANALTSLDFSKNNNLIEINLRDNKFVNLNVSNNTKLVQFISDNNPDLESLNVANGNNTALINMWSNKAPKLTCIQHDTGFDPTASTNGRLWIKDNTASWSNNCNVTASIDDNTTIQFKLYPNPANSFILIDIPTEIEKGEVFNALGKKVMEFSSTKVNIADLSSGFYLIKLLTKNGETAIQKLLKE